MAHCEKCEMSHKHHAPTAYCPPLVTSTVTYCELHKRLLGKATDVRTLQPYERELRPWVYTTRSVEVLTNLDDFDL